MDLSLKNLGHSCKQVRKSTVNSATEVFVTPEQLDLEALNHDMGPMIKNVSQALQLLLTASLHVHPISIPYFTPGHFALFYFATNKVI